MENKFLKVSKRLGAVVLGATLLCVNMQGATLKEIEAQKKAEEAKQAQQLKNVVKNKYGVVYDGAILIGQTNIVYSELKKDIPTKQKDWIMKLIALENANNKDVEQELKGHVIAPQGSMMMMNNYISYCQEATEAYSKKDKDIKEIGRFFMTKHYYADKCILGGVREVAMKYSSIYDKDQYKESELSYSFNEQKYNEKKEFVKWLDEIKFYDYIGGLPVKKEKANEILNMLDGIKKDLSFKKPTY